MCRAWWTLPRRPTTKSWPAKRTSPHHRHVAARTRFLCACVLAVGDCGVDRVCVLMRLAGVLAVYLATRGFCCTCISKSTRHARVDRGEAVRVCGVHHCRCCRIRDVLLNDPNPDAVDFHRSMNHGGGDDPRSSWCAGGHRRRWRRGSGRWRRRRRRRTRRCSGCHVFDRFAPGLRSTELQKTAAQLQRLAMLGALRSGAPSTGSGTPCTRWR